MPFCFFILIVGGFDMAVIKVTKNGSYKGTDNVEEYVVTAQKVSLNALGGADKLTVSAGDGSTFRMGNGDDLIVVEKGIGANNKFYGGADNDTLTVSAGGNNFYYMEAGNDTVTVNDGIGTKNTFNLGSGNDNLTVLGGSSNKYDLSSGNDVVTVAGNTDSNNTFNLGSGTNTVYASAGSSNTYTGYTGVDKFTVYKGLGSGNVFKGAAGNDVFTVGVGSGVSFGTKNYMYGGAGNDTFNLNDDGFNGSYMYGDSGNDVMNLTGGSGETKELYVDSGNGNDTVRVGHVSDSKVYAGNGDDKIYLQETSSNNKVWGGSGNDVYEVYGSWNTLYTGNGSKETLKLGNGSSTNVFGNVINAECTVFNTTVNYYHSVPSGSVNNIKFKDTTSGTVTVAKAVGLNFTGGKYADTAKLNGVFDTGKLNFGLGSDKLYIYDVAKNTKVDMGDGNDTLYLSGLFYGMNTESLYGGSVTHGSIVLANGTDKVLGISGSYGSILNSSLDGGAGNDTINLAAAYNSTIEGGAGNDTVILGLPTSMPGPLNAPLVSSHINLGAGTNVLEIRADSFGGAVLGDQDYNTVIGGSGNDTVYSLADLGASVFEMNAGVDKVNVVSLRNGSVNAGAGDDLISVRSVSGTSVDAGDGNDLVFAGAMVQSSGSLSAASGTAYSNANNVISLGNGNDQAVMNLTNGHTVISYHDGDIVEIDYGTKVYGNAGSDVFAVLNREDKGNTGFSVMDYQNGDKVRFYGHDGFTNLNDIRNYFLKTRKSIGNYYDDYDYYLEYDAPWSYYGNDVFLEDRYGNTVCLAGAVDKQITIEFYSDATVAGSGSLMSSITVSRSDMALKYPVNNYYGY